MQAEQLSSNSNLGVVVALGLSTVEQSAKQVSIWVRNTAQLMVDKPQAVRCEYVLRDGGNVMLKLFVDDGDCGKVIGQEGRMARSFRQLLVAIGGNCKIRFSLDIADRSTKRVPASPVQ